MLPLQPSRFLIYGLVDPRTCNIRYVGKSTRGLKRPRKHSTPSALKRNHTRCGNWIRSLKNQGLQYVIIVLEECPSNDTLSDLERFWIASIRATGADLLNHQDGGQGAYGLIRGPETKEKIRQANLGNKNSLGHCHTEETKRLISQKYNTVLSQEARTRIAQSLRGKKQSQEQIQKRQKTIKEKQRICKPVQDSTGNLFPSGIAAAQYHGLTPAAICVAIKTGHLTRTGVRFFRRA